MLFTNLNKDHPLKCLPEPHRQPIALHKFQAPFTHAAVHISGGLGLITVRS